MKNNKGGSTLKFFVEWLIEKIKSQVRWFLVTSVLIALAYGATQVPQFFHSKKIEAPEVLTEEDSKNSDSEEKSAGFRAPSSLAKPIPEKSDHSNGISSSEENRPNSIQDKSPDISSSASVPQYSDPRLALPQARNYQNYSGNNSSSPQTKSQDSKSASPSDTKPDAFAGTTSLGGSFAPPTPSPSSGGTSPFGSYSPGSGSLPNPFNASSGFQAISGGKICTAPNMQVRVSIGAATNPGVQSAPGMMFVSGIEGVYYGQ